MTPAMFRLSQAADWVPASQILGDASLGIQRVHTDSRTLREGDLFVALRGDRFDGHDFLGQVRSLGGTAALAERGLAQAGLSGLQVDDSRLALGQLAQAWRQRHPIPLIAVTGSNGKTTVTQMLASILRSEYGSAALATEGNFNNDIGVPLTLLRLRPSHRMAVLELGTNHPGEIARLAEWVQPNVALVNNAQREHQEYMHSVSAVAHENGAVFSALSGSKVAVFPADDQFTPLWRELSAGGHAVTFGSGGDVVFGRTQPNELGWHGQIKSRLHAGTIELDLFMPGVHNLRNALAATACALAAGVGAAAIRDGLANFRPVVGRSQAHSVQIGSHRLIVVDDSYNANPDSVRAAIDVLSEMPGPHLLVLGDMGEVGELGPQYHEEVGHYARQRGIEHFLTYGQLTTLSAQAHGRGHHHDQMDSLCSEATALCHSARSVLVKGSRFMRMERVLQHLANSFGKGTASC